MTAQVFLDGRVTLHCGDSRDVLQGLPDASIDSVVTDPPYALVSIGKRFGKAGAAGVTVPEGGTGAYARASAGFMGKQWDTGETAFAVEFWAQVLRVLKPGGHVAAFSGTRTYHRLACAIEDSGFEIRDQLAWCYATGFPKSHDVAKGIDKAAGIWRGRATSATSANGAMAGPNYGRTPKGEPATEEALRWRGWGTALKPAWEPIALGRKPLIGTVAQNVVQHGTGALNIAACRIGTEIRSAAFTSLAPCKGNALGAADTAAARRGTQGEPVTYEGRWPANIVHDGSDEVVSAFDIFGSEGEPSPSRFFYSAKADLDDRLGSKHPTVKPVDLMQWLCRLITPPGGVILDPFAGSGSTGEAAWREGFRAVLIEREPEYQADIARRMALAVEGRAARKAQAARARMADKPADHGPLFGGSAPEGGAGKSTATSPTRTAGPDHRADWAEEVMI
jgi:DNA modification methylase